MRLVGPRPEDPAYVDLTDPLHREVFTAKPGITGLAQLLYVDEAAQLDVADPDAHYRREILPAKLRLDAAYLRHRSTRLDLWILARTPMAILGRRPEPPPDLLREFGS
jgi:lipopolysaccharide/colanic/teichoic acid biosynthesis glycosyltransferase